MRYLFWAKAPLIDHDSWQQETIGKPHNTIITSLAFKWIRILFRCWKTHTPYDESTYLTALKSKGSPLLKFAVKSELWCLLSPPGRAVMFYGNTAPFFIP